MKTSRIRYRGTDVHKSQNSFRVYRFSIQLSKLWDTISAGNRSPISGAEFKKISARYSSACVRNTVARIKSRRLCQEEERIDERRKASVSPAAPSFRLLGKPQFKLAHRELRRSLLKPFYPRSSTRRSGPPAS